MQKLERINIASTSPWESRVGYSRAVRVGNIVEVAGTIATDTDGTIVGEGDAYEQTLFILQKIEKALVDDELRCCEVGDVGNGEVARDI